MSATPSREGFGAGVGMTLLAIFIWGTQLPIAKAVYGSVDGTTLSLLLVDGIIPPTPALMLPLIHFLQADVDRKRIIAAGARAEAVA